MKKILLAGGGTLGPVAPLLAVAEQWKEKNIGEVVGLVGTRVGPERMVAEKAGINFFSVTAGKLRRYGDWRNIFAPFAVLIGFFEALLLLTRLRPTIIFSGGSFVGVPIIFAAWVLRIPSVTHQQDIRPSLANKIVAPFVTKITAVFPESTQFFPHKKIVVTGGPIRASLFAGDAARAREIFHLESDLPTILVFGGGTGSAALNTVVVESLPDLTQFCQIIHLTGKGKRGTGDARDEALDHGTPRGRDMVEVSRIGRTRADRYHVFELLTKEMADAYAVADVVIARAGIGTITEIAALGKAAILVPMPGTHQEENADYLVKKNAARALMQKDFTPARLVEVVRTLLQNTDERKKLSEQIQVINSLDATEQVLEVIQELK